MKLPDPARDKTSECRAVGCLDERAARGPPHFPDRVHRPGKSADVRQRSAHTTSPFCPLFTDVRVRAKAYCIRVFSEPRVLANDLERCRRLPNDYGLLRSLCWTSASQRFPADELRASVSLACYIGASASIPVVHARLRTTTNVCGQALPTGGEWSAACLAGCRSRTGLR